MRLELDFGTVVLTGYGDNGHPELQVDAFGEGESQTEPFDLIHMSGFAGLPYEPAQDALGVADPSRASHMLFFREGRQERGLAFGCGDTRLFSKLPLLQTGRGLGRGSVQYGGRHEQPAFSHFDPETGSWTLYVPYSFTGDTPSEAMSIAVNVRNAGSESIEMVHGSGMSITMLAGGKNSVVVKNKAGDAYVEVNDDGVTMNGNAVLNGAISMGSNVLPHFPVALATPLLSYLTKMEQLIASIPAGSVGVPALVTAFKAASAVDKLAIAATLASGN